MLAQQQKIKFSAFSGLYDLIVPKDNLLRKINELIDRRTDYHGRCGYLRRKRGRPGTSQTFGN